MFSYCLNNPIRYCDPFGQYSITNPCGLSNNYSSLADIEYGGGALPIPLPLPGDISTEVFDQIDELQKAIEKKMAKSLAIAKNKSYRSTTEDHHIVAQGSYKAKQTAVILNQLFPNGVQNEINIITIKTSVHKRIHTNLYYALVNEMVCSAYSSANGDIGQAMENVTTTLNTIRAFIMTLDNLEGS